MTKFSYTFTKVQDDNAKESVEVYMLNFIDGRKLYVYVDREAGTIEYDTDNLNLTIEEDDDLFIALSEDLL